MRNNRGWLVTAIVALIVALLVGSGFTAAAQAGQVSAKKSSGYRPTSGSKFNVARGTKAAQDRLVDQIRTAVKHAKSGSNLRFSMFSFDRVDVAKALVDAKHRGVSVQILVNDHETTHAQRILRRKIGHDRSKGSWIYQCKNGCRSSGENLHTKFFLFSHTGEATNVVMTGSTNLKTNSTKNQYNDLWTRNNASGLYTAFLSLFNSMKKDKLAKPTYWVQNIGSHFQLQAMPKPGYTKSTDPIMVLLRKVKCGGATHHTGIGGHTQIRVMMHAWNGDRGTWIAKKLRSLYGDGCNVKAVYGFTGAKVRAIFHHATPHGRVPIRSTGYDTNGDGELDLYTHQKNMVISGHYGSSTHQRVVVTGSSNWTVDGMRGDEEIFVIKGLGAFGYLHDFSWLWHKRTHSVSWAPTGGRSFHPAATRANTYGRATTDGRPLVSSGDGLLPSGPAWEGD